MSIAVPITQDGTRLLTAGKYVAEDIVVGISDSIKKAAATYTPGTTDQTIAAGQYLAGAQTVKGDANLIAGNIKQGVSIFGVAGSLTPGITPSGTKNITANGTYDVTQFASAAVNVPQNIEKLIFTNIDPSIRTLHIPVANASRFQHAIIFPSTQISSELSGNTTYGMLEMFGVYYTSNTNSAAVLGLTQFDGVEILANEVTFKSAYVSRYWALIDYIVLLW